MPEFISAGTKAVGPGIQSISIFFFIDSLIIRYPGSDIPGVPESDIKETFFPDMIYLIYFSTTLCSLCIWYE